MSTAEALPRVPDLRLLEVAPTIVEFRVPGKPMTWSRASRGNGFTFTPDDRRSYMALVQASWQQAKPQPFARGVLLLLDCEFVFARPSSHFGTGRNAGVLKDSARELRPLGGTNGGDIDNLVKIVADSLNQIAFYDDSQLAMLIAQKRYVEVPRVTVVGEAPPPPEQPHTRVLLRTI